jgi:KipI family sensor histidine kinase inhibitor
VTPASIEALGDGALLIRLGDRIDADVNRSAHALAARLRAAALPGVFDVAAAYASISIRYDIATCADAASAALPHAYLTERIGCIIADAGAAELTAVAAQVGVCEIPVCYGGAFGADLDAVAAHARLSAADVIARHAGADYRVAMLGFMPGFAYLLGLDPALHMPRRASPRTRVPAGSVAIGGAQTGVYPRELPGGWQLIGRTPLTLFDPARTPAALLAPGQRVRFRPIDADRFAALAQ